MGKNNLKTFHVNGRLGLEVCIEIKAENLEDAIQKSKELKEDDFVEFLGDFNAGELRISGVFESYEKIRI